MDATIAFTVNGQKKSVTTDPERPLLDVLREDLGLTGTKYGCGEARCGACTVLLDGKPVPSCTTPVSKAEGKTDARGKYRVRGFLGDYDVTVSLDGKTKAVKAVLGKDGEIVTIRVE